MEKDRESRNIIKSKARQKDKCNKILCKAQF